MRIPVVAGVVVIVEAEADTLAVVMWVEDQVAVVMSAVDRQVEVTSAETVEDILAGQSEVWRMSVEDIRPSVPLR